MNKLILTLAVSFFTFYLSKASVCYNLSNSSNILSISVISNIDYPAPPNSLWATAEVTLSWSTSLGATVIASVASQNGFPFIVDGPVETVGSLHYQKFGFTGASYNFPLTLGVPVEVLQITVAHASIATGMFAIEETPPVIGGTASITGVLGEQFANGACNLVLAAVPLPTRLSAFSAKQTNKTNALISWQTASQVNASHFELKRSFDTKNWTQMNKQAAAGNSNQTLNYQFLDKTINEEASFQSIVYYKLKMVDLDGRFEYSDTESVTFEYSPFVNIFPNPASNQFTLAIQNEFQEEAIFQLINNSGKIVLEQKISIQKGLYQQKIDCNKYADGIYNIVIQGKTFYFTGIVHLSVSFVK